MVRPRHVNTLLALAGIALGVGWAFVVASLIILFVIL